jgi:hypothetical protein
MFGCERLQLADDVRMATEGEVGVDAPLQRREPQLLESSDRRLGEGFVCEVGECGAAPERERRAELLGRDRRLGRPRLFEETFESTQVELVRLDLEQIAGRPGEQDLGAKRLAELRHVHLKRVHRSLGRRLAPDLIDEPIAAHDLIRVKKEDRKYSALPRAPKLKWAIALDDLEGPKDPKLHSIAPARREPSTAARGRFSVSSGPLQAVSRFSAQPTV